MSVCVRCSTADCRNATFSISDCDVFTSHCSVVTCRCAYVDIDSVMETSQTAYKSPIETRTTMKWEDGNWCEFNRIMYFAWRMCCWRLCPYVFLWLLREARELHTPGNIPNAIQLIHLISIERAALTKMGENNLFIFYWNILFVKWFCNIRRFIVFGFSFSHFFFIRMLSENNMGFCFFLVILCLLN